MTYPFSMYGRIIQIYRHEVTYQEERLSSWETEEGNLPTVTEERKAYLNTLEQANELAERTGGSITELDSSSYEWLDGIEVPDVPDTYSEAIKLCEMGKEAWLSRSRSEKQEENNRALAEYLSSHPITWTDGKKYGVTQQDQQEIALNLTQYQLCTAAGLPAKLEWHAVHEECREFTQEELSGLALAIGEYVYPLVRKNQMYKTQIYGADTALELEGITFAYEAETM